MAHSDNQGLVLPPNLAPIQVILIPIFNSEEEYEKILNKLEKISNSLKKQNLSCEIDKRKKHKPGWKFSEYEMKGVPIRIVIGPKDLENNSAEIARRDNLTKETIDFEKIKDHIPKLLEEIQKNLFDKALNF